MLPPIPVVELGPHAIFFKGIGLGTFLIFVVSLANHEGLLQVVIFREETFHSRVISFGLVLGGAVSADCYLLRRIGIPSKYVN